ncbi:hypothetical protein EZS27_016368 [termite gut metagenome]|uniref:Uracil-DNA glycosylase-like domain-containing protein n=1 Tax=termite gut metagenome TaxID=433724 RepID=A0A5J4RNC0_9ZZZZ
MAKFEEELKQIEIFERFPNLIPHVSNNYGNGKHKKLLLVWESYYDSWDLLKDKSVDDWYKDEDTPQLWESYPKKAGKHWNFKCKIDKDGCDKSGGTFLNPEEVLKTVEKEDPYSYCAGYNYFLRPAPEAITLNIKEIDEKYAFEAFKKIVDIIKPDMIAFFSKKSYNSFKKYRAKQEAAELALLNDTKLFENIKIKAVQHPACAWWNKKSGKESKMTGRERFENFIINW